MNKKLIYILMVCYCCTAISKNANFIKTEHVIIQNGQELPYQAAAGKLPVKNTEGKEIGKVFFISYTLNTQEKHRPVTFIFNGGPGSSSVWLHLGAFGPKRVKLIEEGQRITAPYELLDNEETLLGVTDLVFVDPIGTGFSSFSEGVQKDLFSVEGDCLYLSEFIRDYLTENQRWNSPKYIIGESYGSTRTAGLSSYLLEHGIFLNGIILVSSALDFKNFVFSEDNLLPYIFFLPSYTAAAWHHNQLSKTFTSLEEAVAYSRKFAFDVYLPALMKGANLTEREKE
ncbi:MAG: peptidase S10, partial [Chlamydiae bacterium CG10_big_fil_rev_8_21_14_0_10_35_9]